jgi:hypothetical protein
MDHVDGRRMRKAAENFAMATLFAAVFRGFQIAIIARGDPGRQLFANVRTVANYRSIKP